MEKHCQLAPNSNFISFQPKANSQSLKNRLNVPHQFANIIGIKKVENIFYYKNDNTPKLTFSWFNISISKIYKCINLLFLFVCLIVTDKRQNGWTDREGVWPQGRFIYGFITVLSKRNGWKIKQQLKMEIEDGRQVFSLLCKYFLL